MLPRIQIEMNSGGRPSRNTCTEEILILGPDRALQQQCRRKGRPVSFIAPGDALTGFHCHGFQLIVSHELNSVHQAIQGGLPYLFRDTTPGRQFGQVMGGLLIVRFGDVKSHLLRSRCDQMTHPGAKYRPNEDIGINHQAFMLHRAVFARF